MMMMMIMILIFFAFSVFVCLMNIFVCHVVGSCLSSGFCFPHKSTITVCKKSFSKPNAPKLLTSNTKNITPESYPTAERDETEPSDDWLHLRSCPKLTLTNKKTTQDSPANGIIVLIVKATRRHFRRQVCQPLAHLVPGDFEWHNRPNIRRTIYRGEFTAHSTFLGWRRRRRNGGWGASFSLDCESLAFEMSDFWPKSRRLLLLEEQISRLLLFHPPFKQFEESNFDFHLVSF